MVDEELSEEFKCGVLTVLEMLKTEPPVIPSRPSVIEDIKAEIQQMLEGDWSDGLYRALRIIEKHTSGAKMESGEQA